jgi:hypothetical protein
LRLKMQRQRKVENHRVKLEKSRLQKQFQRVVAETQQAGGMIPTHAYNRRDHLKSWDFKGVKYPESEQILKDMMLI